MGPATCNREPRPRPDPSRRWYAIGSEAVGTVAGACLAGWLVSEWLDSSFPLVLLPLVGIAAAMIRLVRSASSR